MPALAALAPGTARQAAFKNKSKFLPLEQIGKPHMTLPGTPLRQLAFVESGLRDFTYGQFLNLNATSAAASFLSFAQ